MAWTFKLFGGFKLFCFSIFFSIFVMLGWLIFCQRGSNHQPDDVACIRVALEWFAELQIWQGHLHLASGRICSVDLVRACASWYLYQGNELCIKNLPILISKYTQIRLLRPFKCPSKPFRSDLLLSLFCSQLKSHQKQRVLCGSVAMGAVASKASQAHQMHRRGSWPNRTMW